MGKTQDCECLLQKRGVDVIHIVNTDVVFI